MVTSPTHWTTDTALEKVLGYLNYSSGATDPAFLSALNWLYAQADQRAGSACLTELKRTLIEGTIRLEGTSRAFDDLGQARSMIQLLFDHGLPAYRDFHSDLLGGKCDHELFQPFFLGRYWECLLAQGGPWDQIDRIVRGALERLNDYIGFRPVATLETQKCEPYRHEWFRPIPLYIQGAGVAYGRYQTIVERALHVLWQTPSHFLRFAQFELELLTELALDPRPYDFDHPASKAPNHFFGMWDRHFLDAQGRYRRFVLQQMTLDAMLERIESERASKRDDLQWEAGIVLAGTILMASATCGSRPDAHLSTVTLPQLIAQIAHHRDAFYEWALACVSPTHRSRLVKEASSRRQPFGGARQHLNRAIADRRARQFTRLQLARTYLRLGLLDEAAEQVERVGTASARILGRLGCGLERVNQLLKEGRLTEAIEHLEEADQLLRRGIECGAIVDPWNILGFAAQFPLFQAQESVPDHRIDELVRLVEQLFSLGVRAWSSAAVGNQPELVRRVRTWFAQLVDWWRQFAAHESPHVKATDPDAVFRGAERVAQALAHWQQAGTAASGVAFWSQHVELFPSVEAYSHVVNALLDRGDYSSSMALLIHWLSRHQEIELVHGEHSFLDLALRWMLGLADHSPPETQPPVQKMRWNLARRFIELLEANADELWSVPTGTSGTASEVNVRNADDDEELLDEDEEFSDTPSEIYRAAYEGMIYRDQTDDGIDSSLADLPISRSDSPSNAFHESIRLRMNFLQYVARLWKLIVLHPGFSFDQEEQIKSEFWLRWLQQAEQFRVELFRLAAELAAAPLPNPTASIEELIEYDQLRSTRDGLVETVIDAAVTMGEAIVWLRSALGPTAPPAVEREASFTEREITRAAALVGALRRGQTENARQAFTRLVSGLRFRPLLYLPLARGGEPRQIIAARTRRRILEVLLICLPRSGLLRESCQLLELARQMDRVNTAGQGAVTEFDELYELGLRSIVGTTLKSFRAHDSESAPADLPGSRLHGVLLKIRERLTRLWLDHSRMLRLSVVEHLQQEHTWQQVRRFITRNGAGLFTQQMLAFGNLRGILHQGVDHWLEELRDHSDTPPEFLKTIKTPNQWQRTIRILTLILESVCENYSEYRDYNSTTTQSDRGEQLFVLLDFLRLQARFHRIWWNLRPITLIYELLLRHEFEQLSRFCGEELLHQVFPISAQLVSELRKLQKKYSVEIATVADRIVLRYKHFLAEEQLRALVRSVHQQRGGTNGDPLRELKRDLENLASDPCGAGFEMPDWLGALDSEVDQLLRPLYQQPDHLLVEKLWPFRPTLPSLVERQITEWCRTPGPVAS